jgi:hypothetical protein
MAHPDVLNTILALAQRFDDRIDAVADHAEAMRRAPRDKGFDYDIGCRQIATELRRRLGYNAG